MSAQNLPVPYSYTESLLTHYRIIQERLNRGTVRDTGIRCVSASVRAGGLRRPVEPDPEQLAARAAAEWAERQKQIHSPAPVPYNPRLPPIGLIKRIVAATYSVRVEHLDAPRRTLVITWPRQIAMYLCRHKTVHSLSEIGRRFGGRDHTTVMHAIKKVSRRAMADDTFAGELMEIAIAIDEVLR